MELIHCGTKEQVADIITKSLKLDVFINLREELGFMWSAIEFKPCATTFNLGDVFLGFS